MWSGTSARGLSAPAIKVAVLVVAVAFGATLTVRGAMGLRDRERPRPPERAEMAPNPEAMEARDFDEPVTADTLAEQAERLESIVRTSATALSDPGDRAAVAAAVMAVVRPLLADDRDGWHASLTALGAASERYTHLGDWPVFSVLSTLMSGAALDTSDVSAERDSGDESVVAVGMQRDVEETEGTPDRPQRVARQSMQFDSSALFGRDGDDVQDAMVVSIPVRTADSDVPGADFSLLVRVAHDPEGERWQPLSFSLEVYNPTVGRRVMSALQSVAQPRPARVEEEGP